MDPLANILSNILASVLADLLMTLGPMQAPAIPPCPTEFVHIMPSDKWVCLSVQQDQERLRVQGGLDESPADR